MLDVPVCGVWRTDIAERRTVLTHLWAAPGSPESVYDDEERTTSDDVVAQMFANDGLAVVAEELSLASEVARAQRVAEPA